MEQFTEVLGDSAMEMLNQEVLSAIAEGNPFAFLAVEEVDPSEAPPGVDPLKITIRIGNGIQDTRTTRWLLQRALTSIPE